MSELEEGRREEGGRVKGRLLLTTYLLIHLAQKSMVLCTLGSLVPPLFLRFRFYFFLPYYSAHAYKIRGEGEGEGEGEGGIICICTIAFRRIRN